MNHSIPLTDTFIEPSKLLVCWQAPDDKKQLIKAGKRYCIAEIKKAVDGVFVFEYLQDTSDYAEAKARGFSGYPAFSPENREHRVNILETFMRRLPPRSRGDYPEFLAFHGIKGDAQTTLGYDFSLLGYTGAQSPADGFTLVHTFETAKIGDSFPLEIAGFRFSDYGKVLMAEKNISSLLGQKTFFKGDPSNRDDPRAVQVLTDNGHIGYINRYQTTLFHRSETEKISFSGTVIRVNGHPEQPSVLLMVTIGDFSSIF
jgi:hypothetical protein